MHKKSRQTTIKDIAKALGVAPSTVSRALNGNPAISQKTRLKVHAKAKELKYEPNIVALSLKKQQTKTIGVIIPELIHFFFSTVISGIEEVAYEHGYTVMVCQSNESEAKEAKDTRALMAHRVDGILISPAKERTDKSHYDEIIERGVPLVFFDRMIEGYQVPYIKIDDTQAAYRAVKHLIQTGSRHLYHISTSPEMSIIQDRVLGFKIACERSGLQMPNDNIIFVPDGDQKDGHTATKKLLKSGKAIDGIFATNDLIAIGAIKAIKEAKLSVPDDVAVLGFSDWQFCDMVEPTLSSVAQPGKEMGRTAAKKLLSLLDNKSIPTDEVTTLQAELKLRESTKK